MLLTDVHKASYLDKSDFHTHLNYARRMAMICRGMNIATNISKPKAKQVTEHENEIRRFAKLSELTAKSVASDLLYCKEDVGYSSICAPWIPVKCYYRLYYLEAIFLFLKGYDGGFKSDGHHKVRSILNAELRSNTIKYNTSISHLGVLEIHECLNFPSINRSANIKNDFWKKEESTKALLRLLARYKFESWKKDKNLYTTEGKKMRKNFMLQNLSIFDYAYQMRLKANYKDLNFLDPDRISPGETYNFISAYHLFYVEYTRAIINTIYQLYPKSVEFIS